MPLFGLVSGLFGKGGLRATVYALFGGLMLSALWVTSLTLLSAPANATDLLTQAGTEALNPFLVKEDLGITPAVYAQLQASGKAHPTQPLALPLLKAQVLGAELAGRDYDDGVRLIYSRVAENYYDGGPDAAFAVPAQLKDQLPDFALFNPNNQPLLPNGPTPAQLPVFVQPLFSVVGLTPTTFTAAGHQNLLGLLPWFWVAAGVLGVLAVALNRSEVKLVALLHGVLHSSWPIVGALVGLWVATQIDAATVAPYAGMLAIVDRAFLPVYGTAFVLSGAGFLLVKLLTGSRKSATQQAAVATGRATSPADGREQAIGAALQRQFGMPAGAPPESWATPSAANVPSVMSPVTPSAASGASDPPPAGE